MTGIPPLTEAEDDDDFDETNIQRRLFQDEIPDHDIGQEDDLFSPAPINEQRNIIQVDDERMDPASSPEIPLALLIQQHQPPDSRPDIPLAQQVRQLSSSPDSDVPLALLHHLPARIVGNSRHTNYRRPGHMPHPHNSNLLWCAHRRHYVSVNVFGNLRTCSDCLQQQREGRARNQAVQNAGSETLLPT